MASPPNTKPLQDAYTRRSLAAVVVWLMLLLGLLFPYFESTRNANELPRLMQGMALVDEGSWAIDGPGARGLPTGPDVSRSEVDGRIYPNKPPGTTVVTAVAYRVARAMHSPLSLRTYTHWARTLAGLLPTLLLAGFMFRRYAPGFGGALAATGVLLYALGTPAASYAHLLYGHQLAAMFLFIGVSLVLDANPRVSMRGGIMYATAGGMLAGCAVAVEYGAVFAALPIAALVLARVRRPGGWLVLVASLAGALLPIVLLGAYHHEVYGSAWSTGYHHVTNADFAEKHGQGLLGLGLPRWSGFSLHMLSMDGGLLWWAPTVVVALYGLVHLSVDRESEHRAEARVHLGLVVLYVLIVSSLSFEGGWRVGPRYLVVVLPSLCVGWLHVLSTLRSHVVGMAAFAGLAIYAVTVNALAANLWPHFDLTNIHQPVAEVLIPLWRHNHQPYALVAWGAERSALRFVMVGSVVGTAVVLFRTSTRGGRMAGGIAVGTVAGLLLVLATQWATAHPMGERNLAYIERIWEPNVDKQRPSVILAETIAANKGGRGAADPVMRINRSRDRPKRRRPTTRRGGQ